MDAALAKRSLRLWTRKDGRHLTASEMLQIARHLNEVASIVIVPDFLDHIHGAISTCQILKEEKNISLNDMMATNLAASILEANVDDKVWNTSSKQRNKSKMRHMMSYVSIALRLARSKTCYEKWRRSMRSCAKATQNQWPHLELRMWQVTF